MVGIMRSWQTKAAVLGSYIHVGHSKSNQHAILTPISDFSETWYIHSMGQVIKPQQLLGLEITRLHSYRVSNFCFFHDFPTNFCRTIYHILGMDK